MDNSEGSVIVVSDVHLGSEDAHSREFCEFLRWTSTFPKKAVAVPYQGSEDIPSRTREITFSPLSRIILLGDIIEMWNPEDQDRTNSLRQLIDPLSILHEMGCDKVYVTGNHDEDIGDMAEHIQNFSWSGDHEFVIAPRHYPEKEAIRVGDEDQPVLIGCLIHGIRYIFLHGHQFDREQISFTIGRILDKRFDPIDTLADLANITMSRTMKFYEMVLVSFLWILFIGIPYFWPVATKFVQDTATTVLLAVAVLFLLGHYPRARSVLSERIPVWWERLIIHGIFLGPGLALIVYLAVLQLVPGLLPSPSVVFLMPVVLVLTILVAITVIPRFVGWAQRGAYDAFNVKDKTVEEALNRGYNDSRDRIVADVVIFGHTHRAGQKVLERKELPDTKTRQQSLLFVNTGCWVDVPDNRPVNTFVYIDRTGLFLLEWKGKGHVTCLFHYSREEAAARYP